MMNVMVVLLAKNGIFLCYRGHEFKNLFACSARVFKSPYPLHEKFYYLMAYNIYNFSCIFYRGGEASFYPQLRYFQLFALLHEYCWLPLLEFDRQPLFVPFGRLQNFNCLYPPQIVLSYIRPLVVISKYSFPIIFLLLDDTSNALC